MWAGVVELGAGPAVTLRRRTQQLLRCEKLGGERVRCLLPPRGGRPWALRPANPTVSSRLERCPSNRWPSSCATVKPLHRQSELRGDDDSARFIVDGDERTPQLVEGDGTGVGTFRSATAPMMSKLVRTQCRDCSSTVAAMPMARSVSLRPGHWTSSIAGIARSGSTSSRSVTDSSAAARGHHADGVRLRFLGVMPGEALHRRLVQAGEAAELGWR